MKTQPFKIGILSPKKYKKSVKKLGHRIQYVQIHFGKKTIVEGFLDYSSLDRTVIIPTFSAEWILNSKGLKGD